MPYYWSDWWGDWYWDYTESTWKWGGGWSSGWSSQGNSVPAASVGPQPENAVPNPPGDAIPNPHGTENDDNWSRPDALEEADATYRLRTLKATPMEYDAVVDAFKDNQGQPSR